MSPPSSIGQPATAPPSAAATPPAPHAPPSRGPLRLGCVSYLNTLPLIEGLGVLPEVDLVPAPPADLIGMLTGGGPAASGSGVDAALVSLIDYQRSPVPLVLIPVGAIASPGQTHTVRLFSRVPVAEINSLCCDAESHTSVALARIILAERYGAHPSIKSVRWGAEGGGGDGCEAVLLIGDKVVGGRAPARDDYPHQLDLGRAWRDLTGLPFVYAVWMCRVDNAGAHEIAHLASVLDRTRRHNATRLGWIASTHAPAHRWPVDEAREYLGGLLSFGVDAEARGAVERFFDLAFSHALIPECRPTRWFGD